MKDTISMLSIATRDDGAKHGSNKLASLRETKEKQREKMRQAREYKYTCSWIRIQTMAYSFGRAIGYRFLGMCTSYASEIIRSSGKR